tara:strand:+ start:26743 stop:27741 length:999 start_codon:yes stop_codon:yes gene_type:complete
MRLFRVAEENMAPSWTYSDSFDKFEKSEANINVAVNASEVVDESVLTDECDKISRCAANGETYYYNNTWDNSSVSHLKEYALACGMDLEKFKSVDVAAIAVESSAKEMVKTASTDVKEEVSTESALSKSWKDPFNLEERSDTSHMDADNWEEVRPAANLKDKPKMAGIIPIRADESYDLNIDSKLAANQNSISNPNAIEELASSTLADNGARLKQEAKNREDAKLTDHAQWEQGKIDAMVQRDIIPHGSVFPTESLTAHTGIGSLASEKIANINADNIPEFTLGETLSVKQDERRASIQREEVKDDWEQPNKSSGRSISDDFGAALNKALNK